MIDTKDNFATYVGVNPKSEGIIGSPFLFEEMKNATVVMQTGKIHENILANIYFEKSELLVQLRPNYTVVPELSEIESITFLDNNMVFKPAFLDGKWEYAYQLIQLPQKQVLATFEKRFQKADVGGAYNYGSKFDQFKEILSYFIVQDGEIKKVKKSKSGLKHLESSFWKEVESYLKENELDLNNPAEMKKVFEILLKEE
ncbi:hypothetical protein GYM62_12540 [Algoriphagus sp. NBT04N3]|uniref:hypothetical protein n=1 Tax=Algoriphagus sp. NBT04N3 TaxID=2705473 RepID=UPI001C628850|nr:hypothetical protein [Algoriphagus sp. NBT04N3]QYH39566.1 hypothetical protein GYM62_12540 [Algoriphagus sp. NBT04N3]